jgi:hypothetical protein
MNKPFLKQLLVALVLMLQACGPQVDEALSPEAPAAPTKPFDATQLVNQTSGAVSAGGLGSALGSPVASASTCGLANQRTPSCAYSSAPEQTYLWTAPFTGTFTFTTNGSGYDTVLHIYDAASGAALGCNDDSASAVQSSVEFNLSAGQQVHIAVDGYAGACGTFALNIYGYQAARACTSVPCMPNLARSATVAVSSTTGTSATQPDARWTKNHAVDGKRDSVEPSYGWSSMSRSAEYTTEWIQFDLGSPRDLNEVQLHARNDATYGTDLGDGFPRDFVIETSNDGFGWRAVSSHVNYPVPQDEVQTFTFPRVQARFVRVRATRLDPVAGSGYYLQLAEVEIYDNPGQVAFTFSNGEVAELAIDGGDAVAHTDVLVAETTQLDSLFTEYQSYLYATGAATPSSATGGVSAFSVGLNTSQQCKFWQVGCWKRRSIDARWPNNTVHFEFHRRVSDTHRQIIRTRIADWNSRTPVQWIEDGSRFSKVRFKVKQLKKACGNSLVGRDGGRQMINIDPDCVDSRTVQHEMGHASGLIHEQQRCDRDTYVTVSSRDNNNRKECGAKYTTFGPYDYSSIMHYFDATAVATQPQGSVGDASDPGGLQLSCHDRLGIHKLYGVAGGPHPSSPDATRCNFSRIAYVAVSSTTGYSSTEPDARWAAHQAYNGERNSVVDAYGWSSMGAGSAATTQWIQFQFYNTQRVSRVDLYPRNDATFGTTVGDGFPVDFTIEVSDNGTSWTPVVTRTGHPKPTSVQTYEFTARTANFLRVRATNLRAVGGSYYFQLAEVEVY